MTNETKIKPKPIKREKIKCFTCGKEVARLIKEGYTSGILDNEAGYRIVWELNVNKFEH